MLVGVRDGVRRRGAARHRRLRVGRRADAARVHPARLHQEAGDELGRQALPGAVVGRRGVLVGRGGGRKTGARQPQASINILFG